MPAGGIDCSRTAAPSPTRLRRVRSRTRPEAPRPGRTRVPRRRAGPGRRCRPQTGVRVAAGPRSPLRRRKRTRGVPAAAPGILTGMILAMARAAGEVAPLMIVGMVKLAPSLPVDHHFPFVHLERKFMHLGFHIYDVGFQSPNVEAARPLVYATAFLLVVVIVVLNLSAIHLRNRLRERYRALDN